MLFMVAEHFLKPQDSYNYYTQSKSTYYLFYKNQQIDLILWFLKTVIFERLGK